MAEERGRGGSSPGPWGSPCPHFVVLVATENSQRDASRKIRKMEVAKCFEHKKLLNFLCFFWGLP